MTASPALLLVNEGERPGYHADAAKRAGLDTAGVDAGNWREVRARLKTRPALAHAHGLTAARACCLGGLGTTVPTLVTLPDPPSPRMFAGLAGQMRRWLLSRALAQADTLITEGKDGRAALLRLFPNLRRHADRIVAWPASAGQLADGEIDLRGELNLGDHVTLIGCVVGPDCIGWLELVIQAAERLIRHGGVAPFQVVALLNGVEVPYSPFVTNRSLGREFAATLDALDLLIAWPPSGAALTALTLGLPVLGANLVGLREWLRGTPSRLFDVGSPASLETALRASLAHPWASAAHGYAPTARRRFDADRPAGLLAELYRRLARQSKELTP